MAFFEKATGTKLNHVPFNGAAPQRNAVFGGHTDVGGMNIGEAMPYNGVNLRILAQAAEVRSALAPDVPTFKEQGVDVVLASERGLVGPKGLPREVQEKLASAIGRIAKNPEFVQQIRAQYTELDYLESDAWRARLALADLELKALWKTQRWTD
jgi:tripartite-type tricarboxylate transporter receptor subunit TctC